MPRANRNFVTGQIWHITHRCHKKEFLLKFRRDKLEWMYWALQAKIRYGLIILNFMITSNHIHLLGMAGRRRAGDVGVSAGVCEGVGELVGERLGVSSGGIVSAGAISGAIGSAGGSAHDEPVIAQALQLMQGRVAQEYNRRKGRHGAFWGDRYHATAIENGPQLVRCTTYIDMNMVRAGAVAHPREWPYCGYGELARPNGASGKLVELVDTSALMTLVGARDIGELAAMRANWIDQALRKGTVEREAIWTESVAVGSQAFLLRMQARLGSKLRAFEIVADGSGDNCSLRRTRKVFPVLFVAENDRAQSVGRPEILSKS
jgi:putative transposase